MRRLFLALSVLPLLVLASATTSCSGSSPAAPNVDLDRTSQRQPGDPPGKPPGEPPRPPEGCATFFNIDLTCTPDPNRPPQTHPGHFMLNTCVPGDNPDAVFMAFKLRAGTDILRIPGREVEFDGEGSRYVGHQAWNRGNQQHGAHFAWNVNVVVNETAAGDVVSRGVLTRSRTQWWIDRNGERQTRTDELRCEFIGAAGDPPGPPEPPGGGDG